MRWPQNTPCVWNVQHHLHLFYCSNPYDNHLDLYVCMCVCMMLMRQVSAMYTCAKSRKEFIQTLKKWFRFDTQHMLDVAINLHMYYIDRPDQWPWWQYYVYESEYDLRLWRQVNHTGYMVKFHFINLSWYNANDNERQSKKYKIYLSTICMGAANSHSHVHMPVTLTKYFLTMHA